MTHHYQPHGVCSRKIYLELDNGLVRAVRFEGGCSGNTQGVARLVEGMPSAGSHPPPFRHPLRDEKHLLP